MSVPSSFRNKPIDQRRLDEPSRQSYQPDQRNEALERVQIYRARNNYQTNRPQNTTEQKPGTGGFTNQYMQADRLWDQKSNKVRAESFRKEDTANTDSMQSAVDQGDSTRPTTPIVNNAQSLRNEVKTGKYGL